MSDIWFDPIAETLKSRLNANRPTSLEFVVGVRVNGVPHIGTYLTLASTFLFAKHSQQRFDLPAAIRIHFLDNDPVVPRDNSNYRDTHFRCVFQERSAPAMAEFLNINYFPYLDDLASFTGCTYVWEMYSSAQAHFEFRSLVLESLSKWNDFKYFVSGPPLISSPTGVRGIGFPCPSCGLFNGWVRPMIELKNDNTAVFTSECCDHDEYSASLTPFNDTFLNLETTFRNVIKEILALKRTEKLNVMIKGLDWEEGLQNVNIVLEILGVSKNEMPPRFLLPVVKTQNGVKLSKSAIQKFSNDFVEVSPVLLDMNMLRTEVKDSAKAMINLSNHILSQPQFAKQPVLPSDIAQMLESTCK